MATTDQRAHPRVPLFLQVQYPEKEGYLADATENLSAGGAFVRTDQPFKIGESVPVVLSFRGLLEPVELVGVVAWLRAAGDGSPAGVGLMIPEDRTDDRARLAGILERMRAEKPPEQAAVRCYRILLVEDNPHIMEMYEYVMKKLAKAGEATLEVTLARDGHDALEKMGKESFDLVVTDLFMPVLDGFELISRMRAQERTKAVPVVAISAGGADAAVQAHAAGADVYLRKPVRFVDVIETVRVLLKL